jgi:hypothetical protein
MQIPLGYAVLVLAIYVLAVARLTRLVNFDQITDPLRLIPARRRDVARSVADEAVAHTQLERASVFRQVQHRWGEVYYFLGCPWCVGMWLSLGFAYLPVWVIGWPWWVFVPIGLACSQVIGMASPLSADDIEIEESPR